MDAFSISRKIAFLRMHIYRKEAASLDFTQNSSFPAKRRQSHAKVNFGDDGKREIPDRSQPFAVNPMLKVPNCEGTFPNFFRRQKTRCALRASL